MTTDEARDIVTMLRAATGGRADPDAVAYFESALQGLDHEPALYGATMGVVTWRRFPSWAEFKEVYRAQLRMAEPEKVVPPPVPTKGIPEWVRRWVAARWLYARFGRERDMRWFQEQASFVDTTSEKMPDGEWEEEAAQITDGEAWRIVMGT